MADITPASDVLCEAMEYLSKLGSNLRSRSENLKDKKIRKDKLRNSHALQKAANKILLLCDLSKKSLLNVETTMKNVLSSVNASQGLSKVGGKSPKECTKQYDTKPKYHYIRYKSHKLKIKNKVSVKHYMSVKVLAKKMSTSMQEKYPVYHNCKLYWLRKRNEEKHSEEATSNSICQAEINQENVCKKNLLDECCTSNDRRRDSNVSESRIDVQESPPNDTAIPEVDTGYVGQTQDVTKSCDFNDTQEIISNKKKQDNEVISGSNKTCDAHQILKPILLSESDGQNDKLTSSEYSNKNLEVAKDNDKVCIKRDRKFSESKDNSKDKLESERFRKNKTVYKKSRMVVESSNSDDEDQFVKKIDEENRQICEKGDKDDLIETITKEIGRKNMSSTDLMDSEDENSSLKTDNRQKDELAKPLIKCVNINKLLMPAHIEESGTSSGKTKESINKTKKCNAMTKRRKVLDDTAKRKVRETNEECEDQYWEQKRREVKSFKSKKFVIKVTPLPRMNKSFLLAHNLQSITFCGSVLCSLCHDNNVNKKEQVNEARNALLHDSDSDKMVSNDRQSPLRNLGDETETVKNSLLNESDSDMQEPCKETRKFDVPVKKVFNEIDKDCNKISLLHDSDSVKMDTNVHESPSRNLGEETEKVKNALLNESDSDMREPCKDSNRSEVTIKEVHPVEENLNEIDRDILNKPISDIQMEQLTQKSNEDNIEKQFDLERVKSSLLNDSSDDISKEPLNKRLRKSDGLSPRSKRKHIMESMHAKKMLLTYSSSSDTEDEQLKNVLKEIKTSLLEGMSGSDEERVIRKVKDNHHKKMFVSSDADSDSNTSKKKSTKTKKHKSKNKDQGSSTDEKSNSTNRKVRSK